MWVAVLFVLSIFGAQLVRVQAFDASGVQLAALNKRLNSVVVPALRGRIVDTKGTVLAASVERRTITVNQNAVATYERVIEGKRVKVGVVGAAERLAPLLGMTADELVKKLMGTSGYQVIAKGVSPLVWREISAMGIPGILSEVTFEREYPSGMTGAPIVGFLGDDGSVAGGVEQMMQAQLAGTPGKEIYEQARDGKVIPWAQRLSQPAVDGQDVRLTIDADIQWFAQNTIGNLVHAMGAKSGTIVVMEAKTGKLRAVAPYPSFDPTDLAHTKASALGNKAFQEVYEPGSTAKVITIAAALEENVVEPMTGVIVPNRLRRADTTFKDAHDHPTLNLTVAGVLAKSSNIGTILATESMPAATLEAYQRSFGLGTKSGIGYPAESAGLLRPAAIQTGSERYTTMFGQGMSVTAVQAAGVFQTIANGGVRVPPSLIEGTVAEDGTFAASTAPQGVRAVSQQTSTEVSQMLEEVVGPGGTARHVAIPGYRIAGKTGTANRVADSGAGYSGYTTSFIGYAPAEDPQFVVAVTLQNPTAGVPSGGS
ncbi:MAG TPA: penicillin-binding protein 2, partial [Dermatophilaceae bacterium]|nr:penicillin-binding protein 2 [Dermatophilaceae bacterium]